MLPPIEGEIRLKDTNAEKTIDGIIKKINGLDKISLTKVVSETSKLESVLDKAGDAVEKFDQKADKVRDRTVKVEVKVDADKAVQEIQRVDEAGDKIGESFDTSALVSRFAALQSQLAAVRSQALTAANALLSAGSVPVDFDLSGARGELEKFQAEAANLETTLGSLEGSGIDINVESSITSLEELRTEAELTMAVLSDIDRMEVTPTIGDIDIPDEVTQLFDIMQKGGSITIKPPSFDESGGPFLPEDEGESARIAAGEKAIADAASNAKKEVGDLAKSVDALSSAGGTPPPSIIELTDQIILMKKALREAFRDFNMGDKIGPEADRIKQNLLNIGSMADQMYKKLTPIAGQFQGLTPIVNSFNSIRWAVAEMYKQIEEAPAKGLELEVSPSLKSTIQDITTLLNAMIDVLDEVGDEFTSVGSKGTGLIDAKAGLEELAEGSRNADRDMSKLQETAERLQKLTFSPLMPQDFSMAPGGATGGDTAFKPEFKTGFSEQGMRESYAKLVEAGITAGAKTGTVKAAATIKQVIDELTVNAKMGTSQTFMGQEVPDESAMMLQRIVKELQQGIMQGRDFQDVLTKIFANKDLGAQIERVTGKVLPPDAGKTIGDMDALNDIFKGQQQELDKTEQKTQKLNKAWGDSQHLMMGVLQMGAGAMPGGQRAAFGITQLAQALPGARTGLLALGVAFVGVGAAIGVVTTGVNALVASLIEADEKANKLARLDKVFGDADAAIEALMGRVENRLGKGEIMQAMFTVKKGDVLASTAFMDDFILIIKEKSRDLGAPFQEVFAQAAQAISGGNTDVLAQLDLLDNGKQAILDYANSVGVSTSELSNFQIQTVLINEVLRQNAMALSDVGDKLPIDRFRDANEKLKTEAGLLSEAFKTWFGTTFSAEIDSAVTWWEGRVQALIDKLHLMEDDFNTSAQVQEESGVGGLNLMMSRGIIERQKTIEENDQKILELEKQAAELRSKGDYAGLSEVNKQIDHLIGVSESAAFGLKVLTGLLQLFNINGEDVQVIFDKVFEAEEKVAQGAQGPLDAIEGIARASKNASSEQEKLAAAENAATTAANQAAAANTTLATSLDAIEGSARRAAFAQSSALIPFVGIQGAFDQGTQWQQERTEVVNTAETWIQAAKDAGAVIEDSVAIGWVQGLDQAAAATQSADLQRMTRLQKAGESAAEKIQDAFEKGLGGLIDSVLKPTTEGLMPEKDPKTGDPLMKVLFGRGDNRMRDDVDEPARQMADIAVNGFKSQYYQSLRDFSFFPVDVLAKGELEQRKYAAQLVQAHTDGLTYELYDQQAVIDRVMEQLSGKEKRKEFIDETLADMAEMGVNVEEARPELMKALGIDVDKMKMEESMTTMTVTITDMMTQFQKFLEKLIPTDEEAPINKLFLPFIGNGGKPDSDTTDALTNAGKSAAVTAGQAMEKQAADGNYGGRAVNSWLTDVDAKKTDVEASGKRIADWWGVAFADKIRDNVPSDLLDILVDELVPIIVAKINSGGGSGAPTGAPTTTMQQF